MTYIKHLVLTKY